MCRLTDEADLLTDEAVPCAGCGALVAVLADRIVMSHDGHIDVVKYTTIDALGLTGIIFNLTVLFQSGAVVQLDILLCRNREELDITV